MLIRRFCFIICMFCVSIISADPPNPLTTTIKDFVVEATWGNFQMQMVSGSNAYNYVSFDLGAGKTKALMATALAAYINDLPVKVYFSGSQNGYWIISNMTLSK